MCRYRMQGSQPRRQWWCQRPHRFFTTGRPLEFRTTHFLKVLLFRNKQLCQREVLRELTVGISAKWIVRSVVCDSNYAQLSNLCSITSNLPQRKSGRRSEPPCGQTWTISASRIHWPPSPRHTTCDMWNRYLNPQSESADFFSYHSVDLCLANSMRRPRTVIKYYSILSIDR